MDDRRWTVVLLLVLAIAVGFGSGYWYRGELESILVNRSTPPCTCQ